MDVSMLQDLFRSYVASSMPYGQYMQKEYGNGLMSMPGAAFKFAKSSLQGIGNLGASGINKIKNMRSNLGSSFPSSSSSFDNTSNATMGQFGGLTKQSNGFENNENFNSQNPQFDSRLMPPLEGINSNTNRIYDVLENSRGNLSDINDSLNRNFSNLENVIDYNPILSKFDDNRNELNNLNTSFNSLNDNISSLKDSLTESLNKLNDLSNSNELIKKLLEDNNRIISLQNKVDRNGKDIKEKPISDSINKNLVSMTSLLERIASATEDTARIQKVAYGLGETSPVRASAIQANLSSVDGFGQSGLSKKEYFERTLKMYEDLENKIKEIKERSSAMDEKLKPLSEEAEMNIERMKNSWKYAAFEGIKKATMFGGKLALGAGIMAGKFGWNKVIKPAGEEAITRIYLKNLKKQEDKKAAALKQYAEAIKSGDPKKIEQAKVFLKSHGISDAVANLAKEGASPHIAEKFMERIRERKEAVPFDNETRESIVTGIPLLLSNILKALNGEDKVWNYELGKLSSSDEFVKAKEVAMKQNILDLQDERQKTFLWYKSGSFQKAKDTVKAVRDLNITKDLAENTLGRSDTMNKAMVNVTDEYKERGVKNIADIHKHYKDTSTPIAVEAGVKAVKYTAKQIGKYILIPVVKGILHAALTKFDQMDSGKKFFNSYFKPNLTGKLSHIKNFAELAEFIEDTFPLFIEITKKSLEDIKSGKKSFLEFKPFILILGFFFGIKDGKPTQATKDILSALKHIENACKGTMFDAVAKAVKWIRGNFLAILTGKFDSKIKTIKSITRAPFRQRTTKMGLKEGIEHVTNGELSQLIPLLHRHGLSDEEIDKALKQVQAKKEVETSKPSLLDVASKQKGNLLSPSINIENTSTIYTQDLDKINKNLEDNLNILTNMNNVISEIKISELKDILLSNRENNSILLNNLIDTIKETFSIKTVLKIINPFKESLKHINDSISEKLEPLKNISKTISKMKFNINTSSLENKLDELIDSTKTLYEHILNSRNNITQNKNSNNINLNSASNVTNINNTQTSIVDMPKFVKDYVDWKQSSSYWKTLEIVITEAINKSDAARKRKNITNVTRNTSSALNGIGYATGGVFGALGRSIQGLCSAFKGLTSFVGSVTSGFMKLASPLMNVVPILVKTLLNPNFYTGILKAVNQFAVLLNTGVKILGSTVKTLATVGSAAVGLIRNIKNAAVSIGSGIKNVVGWLNPMNWFRGIRNGISNMFGSMFKGVKSFFGFGKDDEQSATIKSSKYLRLIAAYTKGTYDNLSILLKDKGLTPATLKMPPKSGIGSIIGGISGTIGKVVKGVGSYFSNKLGLNRQKSLDKLQRENNKLLKNISKRVTRLDKSVHGYIKWKKTKTFFDTMLSIGGSLVSGLTSLLSGIWDVGKYIVTGLGAFLGLRALPGGGGGFFGGGGKGKGKPPKKGGKFKGKAGLILGTLGLVAGTLGLSNLVGGDDESGESSTTDTVKNVAGTAIGAYSAYSLGKGAYDTFKGGKNATSATSSTSKLASGSTKAASKVGGGALKAAGRLARFIPGLGTALTVGMSLYDGFTAATDDEAIMAQTGKSEVGLYDRFKHGLGGVASGLTFGLVDTSTVVNTGEKLANFFSGKGWNTNKELTEDPSKEGGHLSKALSWLNPLGWGTKIAEAFSGDKKEEGKSEGILSKLNPFNWFSSDDKKVEVISSNTDSFKNTGLYKKFEEQSKGAQDKKPIASGISGSKSTSSNIGQKFKNFFSGKGWNTNEEVNNGNTGGVLSKLASWTNPIGIGEKIKETFSSSDNKTGDSSSPSSTPSKNASQFITKNAKPSSTGRCAAHVREGLEEAGYKLPGGIRPPSAYLYGTGVLQNMGFEQLSVKEVQSQEGNTPINNTVSLPSKPAVPAPSEIIKSDNSIGEKAAYGVGSTLGNVVNDSLVTGTKITSGLVGKGLDAIGPYAKKGTEWALGSTLGWLASIVGLEEEGKMVGENIGGFLGDTTGTIVDTLGGGLNYVGNIVGNYISGKDASGKRVEDSLIGKGVGGLFSSTYNGAKSVISSIKDLFSGDKEQPKLNNKQPELKENITPTVNVDGFDTANTSLEKIASILINIEKNTKADYDEISNKTSNNNSIINNTSSYNNSNTINNVSNNNNNNIRNSNQNREINNIRRTYSVDTLAAAKS